MIGSKNDQPPEGGNTNQQEEKAKGFAYRCTEKCVYQGRFYREGDVITLPEKKEVPHFGLADIAGE